MICGRPPISIARRCSAMSCKNAWGNTTKPRRSPGQAAPDRKLSRRDGRDGDRLAAANVAGERATLLDRLGPPDHQAGSTTTRLLRVRLAADCNWQPHAAAAYRGTLLGIKRANNLLAP
jgi:hypothetical protein